MIPDLKNDGIRLSGGFWNTDGSGVMFSTTWNAAETATYDARANIEAERIPLADVLRLRASGGVDGVPTFNLGGLTDRRLLEERILAGGPANFDATNTNQYSFFGRTNDILSRSLFILHGLPLANGYLSPTNPNGTTVLYDMDFIIQHTASTFGATTDWAFNPIYERSGVKLRPVFGGRYQRIDERFSFRGVHRCGREAPVEAVDGIPDQDAGPAAGHGDIRIPAVAVQVDHVGVERGAGQGHQPPLFQMFDRNRAGSVSGCFAFGDHVRFPFWQVGP